VLRFGDKSRLLDQMFVGAQGDVFHTNSVYTSFAHTVYAFQVFGVSFNFSIRLIISFATAFVAPVSVRRCALEK